MSQSRSVAEVSCMSSSDGASMGHIARVLERVDRLVGASPASPNLRVGVASVRDAHIRWLTAPGGPAAASWTFALGSRALAAALTAQIESLDAGMGPSALAAALLEAHWAAALKAEAAAGGRALLVRYDDTYVERLELERGPIDVAQYVKLSLAQERGTATELLEAFDLPRAVMPRVSRVWLRRMAADKALARQVREAMRQHGSE